jgi:hypothetical protein
MIGPAGDGCETGKKSNGGRAAVDSALNAEGGDPGTRSESSGCDKTTGRTLVDEAPGSAYWSGCGEISGTMAADSGNLAFGRAASWPGAFTPGGEYSTALVFGSKTMPSVGNWKLVVPSAVS